jgi:glycosyltransferase involved in cell wall biosynthesis
VEGGLPVTRHWHPPDGRLDRRKLERHLTHVPFFYLSLRTGGYDIAQAVHVSDAQAAARWSEQTGKPSIYSPLGVLDRATLTHRRRRLELTERAIRSCAAVTAPNRFAADELWRWLRVEARVIHPGVDLSGSHPPGREAERPTVFCATDSENPGRWVPLVHDAFDRVARDRPGARLVLLPSTRHAPIRTLAGGAPIVAPDLPETRELVDNPDVGRLFRGADPEALPRMMFEALELASDAKTAAACRERAEDFSVERCVERHLDLYRELLAAA